MAVMGINPVHRLVTPRIWAAGLVAVLLCPLVVLTGVLGSYYFLVVLQGVTPGAFYQSATDFVTFPDLLVTFVKALIFGVVAAAIACQSGMTCARSPVGVGRAVNRATVVTFLAVFVLEFVITVTYAVIAPPGGGVF